VTVTSTVASNGCGGPVARAGMGLSRVSGGVVDVKPVQWAARSHVGATAVAVTSVIPGDRTQRGQGLGQLTPGPDRGDRQSGAGRCG